MARSTYQLEQENLQLAAEIASLRLLVKALIEIDERRRPGLKEALRQVCEFELSQRQAKASRPADREAMAAFQTAMVSLLKPIEIGGAMAGKEFPSERKGPLSRLFRGLS